ncbi:MAG TPA: PQQ-binding-like beta-propeller repeat protein, partial [Planctomycetota bacterium]|nr:PQQ-binding-like beta-propeller repeat protein [Planctomycetota bacterium]
MILLVALALAQEVPDLGTRKPGSDWPAFLGPRHNGTSDETGLPARWPEKGPRLVWQRELGEGFAACSVARGRLFQYDRGRLQCLKSETGEPIWTYEHGSDYRDSYGSGDGPRCCPVVDGERVFILGPDGLLQSIRVNDGSCEWKVKTSTEFGVVPNFFGVGSTPIVEGDLLLCMIGGSPPNSPGIESGDVRGQGSGIVAFE